jgi:hypothetical protein
VVTRFISFPDVLYIFLFPLYTIKFCVMGVDFQYTHADSRYILLLCYRFGHNI